jgi:hypothetical protein
VDLIREGTAPEIIRRKGAEGNLPVALAERIEVLTILCGDREEGIRQRALETLRGWNPQELQHLLADPATPPAVLDFAANQLASGQAELLEALLENSSLPAGLREEIGARLLAAIQESTEAATPPAPAQPEAPAKAKATEESTERETLIQKIERMSAVEKIKAAFTGNQEMRMILIRDPNKVVARAVLQSAKLSDTEIEGYAAAKNVSEEVLRLIGTNRVFKKNYGVIRALINNPRAPIDVTLPLMDFLNERDLKFLTLNRNIPDVIRRMAIKMKLQREQAAKPKLPIGKH